MHDYVMTLANQEDAVCEQKRHVPDIEFVNCRPNIPSFIRQLRQQCHYFPSDTWIIIIIKSGYGYPENRCLHTP